MTTIYEIKIKEVKEPIGSTCDWCKKRMNGAGDENYEFINTDIMFSVNDNNHAGKSWKIEDLCSDCGERLKNTLIDLGIEIKVNDWW